MNLCACTHKHIKSKYVCTMKVDLHRVCIHKTPQIYIELEHPSFMNSYASVPHAYASVVAEIGAKLGSYLGQNITMFMEIYLGILLAAHRYYSSCFLLSLTCFLYFYFISGNLHTVFGAFHLFQCTEDQIPPDPYLSNEMDW